MFVGKCVLTIATVYSKHTKNQFTMKQEKRIIKGEGDDLSPRVQQLRGILKTGQDLDYKQLLTEELTEQYYNK